MGTTTQTTVAATRRLNPALSYWSDDYNMVRQHNAIGNVPPAIY
jgi:hypothetical protein